MDSGIIFNVQRYTIHDGPGLRTEFFLKGCPLRCPWCGNPESQKSNIELGIYSKKCIGVEKCGDCIQVCKQQSLLFSEDGKIHSIDKKKCVNCRLCAKICPSVAIKEWGKVMSVEDCMEIVRKDKHFYETSGGGVTISGGDPLVQVEFVVKLFKACRLEKIHTCFESDFHAKFNKVEKLLPYTDLFIADLKHMDSLIHKQFTGVGNELILECLEQLAKTGIPIILRIPIIPNFNDTQKNMEQTADFILNNMNNNVRTLQLLSFMRLGEEKYKSLNLPYPMQDLEVDREVLTQKVHKYVEYFSSRGIHAIAGTKEKHI
ncbi:MAG: glycyl-radical enzyme activating protein [Epulopiscium sp. Nele67-Bin005]|nr:MAG: glycyl-radical enzyme activating protein [Epulopiscium sp. Nele67-Bin005]